MGCSDLVWMEMRSASLKPTYLLSVLFWHKIREPILGIFKYTHFQINVPIFQNVLAFVHRNARKVEPLYAMLCGCTPFTHSHDCLCFPRKVKRKTDLFRNLLSHFKGFIVPPDVFCFCKQNVWVYLALLM